MDLHQYQKVKEYLAKDLAAHNPNETKNLVLECLDILIMLAEMGFNTYEMRTMIERAATELDVMPDAVKTVDGTGANKHIYPKH